MEVLLSLPLEEFEEELEDEAEEEVVGELACPRRWDVEAVAADC